MDDDLITSAEAAELLGVVRNTISKMVSAGRLSPALRAPGPTGAMFFRRVDVERLICSRGKFFAL